MRLLSLLLFFYVGTDVQRQIMYLSNSYKITYFCSIVGLHLQTYCHTLTIIIMVTIHSVVLRFSCICVLSICKMS